MGNQLLDTDVLIGIDCDFLSSTLDLTKFDSRTTFWSFVLIVVKIVIRFHLELMVKNSLCSAFLGTAL